MDMSPAVKKNELRLIIHNGTLDPLFEGPMDNSPSPESEDIAESGLYVVGY